ncbi:MAG: HD domain-containing protein [Candidatus Cloacimonetes bacterium]|nr:HD domain-containing protein [Candidatus Cloacimonadota bacterium]
MEKITLKEFALPLIKSIDSFNYLLKSHHRRVAVISYFIGLKMGLSEKYLTDLVIAAALHDIGALSVQERDMLIQEDVDRPEPHCIMGHRMLVNFSVFGDIAQIIKHHHIKFEDLRSIKDEVKIESHIIHLADRIDISINPDVFILNQKQDIRDKVISKKGLIFHPEVCDAFLTAAKADIFWMEINNMTLEQVFNKLNTELYYDLTREQMIEFALVVSRIIDFRSKFTASHSFTVGQLAYNIGRNLGYDDDKCTKLLIAGYFHDIGKVGIDTAYIEKPGPLSDEEFNLVKLHTYYTGQILNELSKSEWFTDIIYWATHHHEKKDGSGYPYAKTDTELCEETKVVAFSDVISALMENRPYRAGMSAEKAFGIIEEKIAPAIDSALFENIKKEINTLDLIVQDCQRESREIYTRNMK